MTTRFQTRKWPQAILHIDGDYFFVSVLQAIHPELKGKPVIAGAERGIATAMSPEAKALGITRGMPVFKIKKQFPQCIIRHGDFETYAIFSKKMFDIVRRYSPTVEEYGIEEGFVDLTGLRRPLGKTYEEIGKAIKQEVEQSLGISVSVGISLTKSLAKLASNAQKPHGLVIIDGLLIPEFLKKHEVGKVWGIGPSTSSYMKHLGIHTAYDFATKSHDYVKNHFAKPQFEIWNELQGNPIYMINAAGKTEYKGITRSQTFTPSTEKDFLWARVLEHVEDAFKKARRYGYNVGEIFIFLKTQEFRYYGTKIKLSEKTSLPFLIHDQIRNAFEKVYRPGVLYRSAGATISAFEDTGTHQPSLFADQKREEKVKNLYPLYDQKKIDFAATLFDPKRKVARNKPLKFTLPMFFARNGENRI